MRGNTTYQPTKRSGPVFKPDGLQLQSTFSFTKVYYFFQIDFINLGYYLDLSFLPSSKMVLIESDIALNPCFHPMTPNYSIRPLLLRAYG